MKKGLKIAGIIIACILVLMIVLPYAFRGKIKELVVVEGNKMLNAQFDFESLDISLFKNFPKASITLNNFWLKGVDEFENDTLAQIGELTAAVNVMSLFGDSGYDISKIALSDAYLKAIVLENGKPNWDVMKADSTAVEEEVTDEESSPFKIILKSLTLKNINVIYDDRQGKMYADISNLGASCSGDLSSEHTVIKLNTEAKSLTFKMDGVPFLSKANIQAKMDIDADLANNKFTLKDNELRLNAIKANIDGWVALLENDAIDMDLKLNTNDVSFKEILSLIPAIYAKDFADIKTTGSVSLAAQATGSMAGENLPQFYAEMNVKDATFRYPSLPMGVDKINIHASVKNPGGSADKTDINVTPFSFVLGGNSFSVNATVKTPVSDPDFSVTAKGMLNLGMIKDVYPLEDMELNGVINADMQMAGRLSYVEKEEFDKFNASGTVNLSNMTLKMSDMPDIDIKKSTFTFTPQYLNLSETTVNIGENDITTNCRLENYMGFALKGSTIKGNLNIQSNKFNLNDFMSAAADSTEVVSDTTAMAVIEIPKNIDFTMDANMKQVLFDKMQFNNVNGKLVIRDGKVDMKNLSTNTMGGAVVINGYYSTAANPQNPELNAGFNMSNLSFTETYKALDMVQQMAPIFEGLKGNFSGNMKIDTKLDNQMSPLLDSMQGSGSLATKDLSLSGVNVIDQIADALSKPDMKNITVKDMNIDFTIKDGRIQTKPFDIKMGETTMNLSGSTGLDQTINYAGKIKLPASTGLSQLTTVDLKIGGTFTSPKVSLDTKSMVNQAVDVAKEKALDEIGKKLGIDISDATKQKEALVNSAKSAGEKLVQEAQKQADDLVKKAGSNAIKKLAAQKGGEALVKEAQKQADKLVQEAEKQGDALIEKAKTGEEE